MTPLRAASDANAGSGTLGGLIPPTPFPSEEYFKVELAGGGSTVINLTQPSTNLAQPSTNLTLIITRVRTQVDLERDYSADWPRRVNALRAGGGTCP